jgi:hypothetical protein
MSTKSLKLLLVALGLALPVVMLFAAGPVPLNIVRVQAVRDCYFGGNENQAGAQQGSFGSVYIQHGTSYDWHVSHNGARLYYGTILSVAGQPMPRMTIKGSQTGGGIVYAP